MAGEDRRLAGGATFIDFQTEPSRYRHWKLAVDGDVATLTMDVDENEIGRPRLNSSHDELSRMPSSA